MWQVCCQELKIHRLVKPDSPWGECKTAGWGQLSGSVNWSHLLPSPCFKGVFGVTCFFQLDLRCNVEALSCSVCGILSLLLWARAHLLSMYFLSSPFPTLFSVNNHSNMFGVLFTYILIKSLLFYTHAFYFYKWYCAVFLILLLAFFNPNIRF